MDARPQDWPRFAPLVLVPIALVAALIAFGVIAAAADRSAAVGAASAAGAVVGLVAAGWGIGAVRSAYRHGTWTTRTRVRTRLISFAVSLVVVPIAFLARGPVQLVAGAVVAGGVFAMTAGSLLWRHSVLRAHRR